VFNPGPNRRIVLATNVAETSLTVPRIRYVVDPGFARVKRYSPRNKLDRLHIEPISQASANQRKGRCGRIAEASATVVFGSRFRRAAGIHRPEIRRSSLAGVILRMLQLGLGWSRETPQAERASLGAKAPIDRRVSVPRTAGRARGGRRLAAAGGTGRGRRRPPRPAQAHRGRPADGTPAGGREAGAHAGGRAAPAACGRCW
jgi:ATP-dependent helicase HrpA